MTGRISGIAGGRNFGTNDHWITVEKYFVPRNCCRNSGLVVISVKIYADYGENSLDKITILSIGIFVLYIGCLIIDSLPL